MFLRIHLPIIHAARFDRKHAARMICNADVAEGQVDQPVLGEQEVGFVALRLNLAITAHRKSMRLIGREAARGVPDRVPGGSRSRLRAAAV